MYPLGVYSNQKQELKQDNTLQDLQAKSLSGSILCDTILNTLQGLQQGVPLEQQSTRSTRKDIF